MNAAGPWPDGAACPTEDRHRFVVSALGVPVAGIALTCPNCAGTAGRPGAVANLAETVAIRRRTIVGLASLPEPARAELAAAGALTRLYRAALIDLRDAAQRCLDELGAEPPAALRGAVAQPDRVRADRVLDAATEWLATLPAGPRR